MLHKQKNINKEMEKSGSFILLNKKVLYIEVTDHSLRNSFRKLIGVFYSHFVFHFSQGNQK